VVTDITVTADGRETANGRVIAVQAPDAFVEQLKRMRSAESSSDG
jgi:hypothetical protein